VCGYTLPHQKLPVISYRLDRAIIQSLHYKLPFLLHLRLAADSVMVTFHQFAKKIGGRLTALVTGGISAHIIHGRISTGTALEKSTATKLRKC